MPEDDDASGADRTIPLAPEPHELRSLLGPAIMIAILCTLIGFGIIWALFATGAWVLGQ